MTDKEFVIWFKGFVAAANTFNITPKQWDTICEYLDKVQTDETSKRYSRYTLDNENWNASNTSQIQKKDNLETKTILND